MTATPFVSSESRAQMPIPVSSWILNPFLDLMFCCGGLVWILFLVQDHVLPALNPAWVQITAMIILASAHLFGEAHISATLFKIFRSKETRSRFEFCTVWQPIFWSLICVAGLLIPSITVTLLKLYLLWVYQHFSGQAYGLIIVYCIKQNYELDRIEKKTLSFLLNNVAAVAIARQLVQSNVLRENFLGLDLPAWNFLPDQCCVALLSLLKALVCVFAFQICWKWLNRRILFPIPAILMLTTIVCAFAGDKDTSAKLWMYLPAFFHATQYLAVTVSQHLRESPTNAKSADQVWKEFGKLSGLKHYSNLLLLSVGLYVLLPFLLKSCGFSQELSFASVFVVLNLHHFMTDMVIWKMRDPETRKGLV